MASNDPKQAKGTKNVLDAALSQWKATRRTSPGLSAATRGEILSVALASRPEASAYRPLLGIIPQRLLAGAVPMVAAVAVLLLFAERMGDPSLRSPLTVRAAKSGDDVVFTIANGGRPHRVVKSTVPTRFDPSDAVTVRGGAYRDTVVDSAGLVFYRID